MYVLKGASSAKSFLITFSFNLPPECFNIACEGAKTIDFDLILAENSSATDFVSQKLEFPMQNPLIL